MILFIIFLSLIFSSLFLNGNYIFSFLFLTIIFYLIFIKLKRKKLLIYLIVSFLIILIFYLFIKHFDIKTNIFIILERKEKYVIIFNGFKKYYLKVDASFQGDVFDLIKIKDYSFNEIDFTVLESGFDFNIYLKSKNVIKSIETSSYDIYFNFPFNFYFFKINFLNKFEDENVKNLVGGLLFSSLDYKNENTLLLKELSLINLFSLSGIFLNFILYNLKKLFDLFFKEKEAYVLSFLTFFPFLFINIYKLTTLKIILFYLLNFINKFYLNKRFERIEIISIGGIILILFNFNVIYQSGFYISFIFYFYLYFLSNKIRNFNKIKKILINKIMLMLLILPFSISFSNSVNLISFILMNLFLPVSKLLFIIALLTLLFLPTSIISFLLNNLINIFKYLDKFSLIIHIPKFNSYLYIIYFLLLFLFLYYYELNFKVKYQKICYILVIFLTIYIIPIDNYISYEVSFINIGQGDATLIRDRSKAYLIDTGGLTYTDVAINNLIPYLKSKRIYYLDSVFITHYDYDHYGALTSLNNNFKINNIYDYNNFNEYNGSLNIINLNNYYNSSSEENDKSLVLYLSLYKYNFLFMGDATTLIEKEIMNNYISLNVDYLKLGHHGSKTSSSLEFLKFISPKEAIISCGKNNKYKHPSKETIISLNKLNISYRRTDLEGTIKYKFYCF